VKIGVDSINKPENADNEKEEKQDSLG